jgi:hypothetical protein
MISKRIYLPIMLLAMWCLGLVACTQQRAQCLIPTIASLNIEFMHLIPNDTSFVDTAINAAVFVALTKKGEAMTVYRLQQSVFTISLSSDTDYCQWLFKPDTTSSTYDTLTFYYQRSLQFLSNACGFAYFYSLDSVHTTHWSLQLPNSYQYSIDSAYIINASVTNNVNIKQLQVYIHDTTD